MGRHPENIDDLMDEDDEEEEGAGSGKGVPPMPKIPVNGV